MQLMPKPLLQSRDLIGYSWRYGSGGDLLIGSLTHGMEIDQCKTKTGDCRLQTADQG